MVSKIEEKMAEMQQQINELTDLCEQYNNDISYLLKRNQQLKTRIDNIHIDILGLLNKRDDSFIRLLETVITLQQTTHDIMEKQKQMEEVSIDLYDHPLVIE